MAKTAKSKTVRPRRGETPEHYLERAILGARKQRPGRRSLEVADDLLRGRPAYDPVKGEYWLVVSAAAKGSPRGDKGSLIMNPSTPVDVLGGGTEHVTSEEAQLLVYAVVAAVGALSRIGLRALDVAAEKDPAIKEALFQHLSSRKMDTTRSFTAYPSDHPYHG